MRIFNFRQTSRGKGLICLLMFWLPLAVVGCAAVPKTLQIEGTDKRFPADTIIAAHSQRAMEFEALLQELDGIAMVFIGEIHSSPAHHAIQLKLIRALHQRRPKLLVGMEMFDRSYQPVLDLWSQGALDVDSFIRRTHWYSNWRFDFDLYREILTYLQENTIPLVGLDLPTYIHGRIRAGGIESLSAADRKWLPDEVPPGDDAHRTFMEQTFQRHQFLSRTTSFEDFYAAQCARDAAMARSIADYLGEGSMVILVGNGHIRAQGGVPQRAHHYTGKAYKTIYLAPVGDQVPENLADYIWVTSEGFTHPQGR